jgi:predicted secreted protein
MDVVVGRPFGVVLADRPGSGHAWSCRALPDGITLLDTRYLADVPREVGSPRDKEFRLVAERPGQFTLVFELKRSWEATPVEERTVRIRARSSQETTDGGGETQDGTTL